MNLKNKKILFVAQDLGGFNALLNVISVIKKQSTITVLLAGKSIEFARRNKIEFIDATRHSSDKFKNFFITNMPDVVVTGTSMGYSLEKKIINLAKENKIPTISLVDFWTNHNTRFFYKNKSFIPDIVCAIDNKMKQDLISAKIPEKNIRITGNPLFESFKKFKKTKGKHILFIEQPFTELYNQKEINSKKPVFDQVKVLKDLILALKKINSNLPLLVKLHPRTIKKDVYKKIPEITITNIELEELLCEADLVVGMNSMALFEASLRGKKVLSYQPGINVKDDPLPSNLIGLSYPVYNKKDLVVGLKKMMSKKEVNNNKLEKYIKSGTTRKITKIIVKII